MAANDMGDWRELFDVALFELNKVKLRQRIEHARHAINNRLNALMKDQEENGRSISEHIALRDALTTLGYTRSPMPGSRARVLAAKVVELPMRDGKDLRSERLTDREQELRRLLSGLRPSSGLRYADHLEHMAHRCFSVSARWIWTAS